MPKLQDFNSRPSARGDMFFSASTILPFNFNSRPSARGDNVILAIFNLRFYFNSRPPRGATTQNMAYHIWSKFQFTPLREGRQLSSAGSHGRQAISIHAPPRGATDRRAAATSGDDISIHAPPRGATGVSFSCLLWLSISIHAPPRGATLPASAPMANGTHFNSRPSARGD